MRAKRSILFGVVISAVLAPSVLGAGVEDRLWRAYTEGPPEKRAVLSECVTRMESIRHKALLAVQPLDWSSDPDVQWLISHRTPARLVVQKELQRQPGGFYLDAVLVLTPALDNGQLQKCLPALLWAAKDDRSRLQLLTTMAEVRGADSLAALKQFLAKANKKTPEELICAAARGLGLTHKTEYLPVLTRVLALVQSDVARLRIDAARYQCGEQEIALGILQLLEKKNPDPALRLAALNFFLENPLPDAVPVLGDVAVESAEPQEAELALRALLNCTGFGPPPAPELGQPTAEPTGEEAVPAEESEFDQLLRLSEHGFSELTNEDRRKLVNGVLNWWAEHPDRTPQPVLPIDGKEAPKASEKSMAQ